MFDTLTGGNANDFRQRYNGTYGYLSTDSGKLTVLINEVSADRVSFTDHTGRSFYAYAGEDVEFEFVPIQRGFIQCHESKTKKLAEVFYLSRIPQRQWHRGIHETNTHKSILGNTLQSADDYTFLYILHNSSNLSSKEKYNRWREHECDCVALNKYFAISANKNVFFLNKLVGVFVPKSDTITLWTGIISQELNDLIQRQKLNIKVKVDE